MLTALPGGHFEHGSRQLDLTIPVRLPLFHFGTFILVQYFDGYAESLVSYNQHTDALRAGIQFVAVGAVSHSVLQGVFIGDYTAAVLGADGVLHPCWTDFRGNPGVTSPNQDSYSDAIRLEDD